jgi:hypothetical protein
MKLKLIRKIMAVGLVGIGLFSPFAMADNASSAKEIAGIVVGMSHFPSDAEKAQLMAISADDSLADAVRAMATAVSNISHAANAEGKAAMANIVGSQAPDRAKALAGAIASFNHAASADDKTKVTELFEL